MSSSNLERRLAALEQELAARDQKIQSLERENAALRRLTSSKRFRLATKVADTYNQAFPQGSKRRAALSKLATSAGKRHARQAKKKSDRLAAKLKSLAAGYDRLIVFNSTPYDTGLRQRSHHLAHEFARLGYFVIYLEPDNPVHPLRQIASNFVTINSYAPLEQLDNPRRYFLTPNNAPTDLKTLESLKSAGYAIIYDYLDEFHEAISGDLSAARAVWEHLDELDPALVLVTARRLEQHLKSHSRARSLFLPNAVDLAHFDYHNPHPTPPADLAPILAKGHKIVGFYGALAEWTDFALLNTLAEQHPDELDLVLLGVDYDGSLRKQQLAPNIHYLGAKSYDELPAYSAYFDCAIIPFLPGDIAKSTSPLKLYEYLAAGLPTVCTQDLLECAGYPFVYLAKDAADFSAKVHQAITDHADPDKRAALFAAASANTWPERAATLDATLATLA